MAMYPVLIFGCLCAISLTTGDYVPTIAISCGITPLLTLPKYQPSIDTLGFKKLLASLWNDDTKVIVILDDELSLEDFTMKGTDGHSLFQLFENVKDRRFFPSVDQPEKAVEMLSKNGFTVKAYNDNTYIHNSSGKIIALADFNEKDNMKDHSRQSTLLKHNNDMSNMFNNLCKQYTNVVLVFSGKLNPWIEKSGLSNNHHLVTRHLMATESKHFILKDSKIRNALVYSASYPTLTADNVTFTVEGTNSEPTTGLRDSAIKIGSTFTYNKEKIILRFRFEKTTFTWALKGIEFELGSANVLLEPKNNQTIGAPLGLSYFSKGPVVFTNGSIVLTFNDTFQVQPWLTSTGDEKFNDPQAQDSFFTPPILAGLFVSALMLFIVTWGITMIMDIKIMDRFDDPKGKTITINVAE
ncbi:ATPase, V1 complex, subunit S1 [Cinara cedri]|uniref:ATPase, V1 complex, subunit S1 n=1 Tax=Cinara cedri TaxID=506608 RepID=A0A5E4MIE5_9HEMI|nr:ATPase, V1 complex, subunit S1 [Cinara cedri]